MSVLIFFVVLVVLILVHELGHFLVAKRANIRVDEFGIGFPPKLYGKKYGETEYTVNALPIGGFVRIYGEDPTEEHENGPDAARSFIRAPRYIQAAVLVAGVTMNVLFAWLLFTLGFLTGMPTAVEPNELDTVSDPRLLITQVFPDTPASEALKGSDEIRGVRAGEVQLDAPFTPERVSDFVASQSGKEVVFSLVRRGEEIEATVVPKTGVLKEEPDRAAAGFSMSLAGTKQYPVHLALWEGARMTYESTVAIVAGLGGLLYDAVRGEAKLEQVSGPVGIVGLVGDAASLGFAWLITFSAFISLNLAVINILPFPALDGGRLLFVAIESVTKRRIKSAIANTLNRVGFALLIGFMVLVTWSDIAKLV